MLHRSSATSAISAQRSLLRAQLVREQREQHAERHGRRRETIAASPRTRAPALSGTRSISCGSATAVAIDVSAPETPSNSMSPPQPPTRSDSGANTRRASTRSRPSAANTRNRECHDVDDRARRAEELGARHDRVDQMKERRRVAKRPEQRDDHRAEPEAREGASPRRAHAPKPSTARMSTATPRYSLCRWMPLRPEYALRIPLNCGMYVLISSSSGNENVVAYS